jgi:putative RNA 2'-phosphotransferase
MTLDQKSKRRISKFLSLVLRHRPEKIGITLDDNGWVAVPLLVEQCNKHGFMLSLDELDEIVETNDKKRFAYSQDGTLIRASQGHSVSVNLDLDKRQPPDILYHGTVEDVLPDIRRSGLLKMSRQHVHLSPDLATAKLVGNRRRSKTVILRVEAYRMWKDSHTFYLSANGVWLTDHIPATYILFPSPSE